MEDCPGAPSPMVQALTLSSIAAFSAVPAPLRMLLGLQSESRQRSTSSCCRGSSYAAASQLRTRRDGASPRASKRRAGGARSGVPHGRSSVRRISVPGAPYERMSRA